MYIIVCIESVRYIILEYVVMYLITSNSEGIKDMIACLPPWKIIHNINSTFVCHTHWSTILSMKWNWIVNSVTVFSCFLHGYESVFPNAAAVLSAVLQGAVSAACNIYIQFILWFCFLVHCKHIPVRKINYSISLSTRKTEYVQARTVPCFMPKVNSPRRAVLCTQHRVWLQEWVKQHWDRLWLMRVGRSAAAATSICQVSLIHSPSLTLTRDATLSSY